MTDLQIHILIATFFTRYLLNKKTAATQVPQIPEIESLLAHSRTYITLISFPTFVRPTQTSMRPDSPSQASLNRRSLLNGFMQLRTRHHLLAFVRCW